MDQPTSRPYESDIPINQKSLNLGSLDVLEMAYRFLFHVQFEAKDEDKT
jgi:hypothetical protein